MTGRFADLDALLDEIDGKPVTLRAYGKRWTLPSSVPADLMLRIERVYAFIRSNRDDADAEVPETDGLDAVTVAKQMCGEDNVDVWLREHRMSSKALWAVIFQVMAIHNGWVNDDDDPDGEEGAPAGKTQAPNRGRSGASSKTSGRSKRTSGRTTASGSPKSSRT